MEVKLEELLQRDGETLLEVLSISKEQAGQAITEGIRKYQTPSAYFEQMKIDGDTVVNEMIKAIESGADSYSIITARILLKQRETIDLPDFMLLWLIVKHFMEEHKNLFCALHLLGNR